MKETEMKRGGAMMSAQHHKKKTVGYFEIRVLWYNNIILEFFFSCYYYNTLVLFGISLDFFGTDRGIILWGNQS